MAMPRNDTSSDDVRTLPPATTETRSPEREGSGVTDDSKAERAHSTDDIPLICFDEDICRLLGFSRRTLQRLVRARVFPIPMLPALDTKRRWSREAVEAFLASTGGAKQANSGRVSKRR